MLISWIPCNQQFEQIWIKCKIFSLEGRVTRAERQKVLVGAYGFQCRCEACDLDDDMVEEEDQLRREVNIF